MDNIKFIRDDIQEKKIKQLQEILNVLQTKPKDSDVEAAQRFFYSMLKASQEIAINKRIEEEKKKKEIEQKKEELRLKKEELKPSAMQKLLKEEIPILPEIKIPKPEIPKPEEPRAEDMITSISKSYPLILFKNTKGEAVVHTKIITKDGKIIYEITEPEIDFRLVKETEKLVQKDFQKDKKIIKDEKFLTNKIKKAFKNLKIDYTEEYKEEIKYYLYKHMLGMGRIDALAHDPNITAIMCDGINKPVKIAMGPGIEVTTNIIYMKKEELDEQLKQLGMRIKNEVSENNPVVEGQFYHFKIEATLGMGEAESKFVIKKTP